MQDATVGEGVVVFTGVVGGGLVCTLHTQHHHISCSNWQRRGGCRQGLTACCALLQYCHPALFNILMLSFRTYMSDMAFTSTSRCLGAAAGLDGKLSYNHSSRALITWTDYRLRALTAANPVVSHSVCSCGNVGTAMQHHITVVGQHLGRAAQVRHLRRLGGRGRLSG